MRALHRDLLGQVFGQLTVTGPAAKCRFGNKRWSVRCACGTEKAVNESHLVRGIVKACGCVRRKHGAWANEEHKASPEYSVWQSMVQRCTNPAADNFAHYGGRGIRVCDAWRSSFEAFFADMGARPDGATIDRINVNGHYEPGNCRWATTREQSRNRRDTVMLTVRGETLCQKDWAVRTGVHEVTIRKWRAAGGAELAQRKLDASMGDF